MPCCSEVVHVSSESRLLRHKLVREMDGPFDEDMFKRFDETGLLRYWAVVCPQHPATVERLRPTVVAIAMNDQWRHNQSVIELTYCPSQETLEESNAESNAH